MLKRVVRLYEEEGWRPVVAPEMEFYLIKPNLNPNEPIEPPVGRTGRQMVSRQAYSMSAVDEYGKVIDDIYEFAEAQGFEIDTIIQEGGAGQVEINLLHGDPVKLADQVFFFKRTIREAALAQQLLRDLHGQADAGRAGLGDAHPPVGGRREDREEHLHRRQGGADQGVLQLPRRAAAAHPDRGLHAGALRQQLPPLRAARLGADQPRMGAGQPHHRACASRSPSRSARRIENRVVGMDCNPYLALAASLACGYLGMKAKLKPREAVSGEAYHRPRALPRDLLAALDLFEECPEITGVLGADFCNLYKAIKRDEVETFLRVISPWERDHLLLNV